MSKPEEYWSRETRDRWFFGFLTFSTLAVVLLFAPFLAVLLFAVVLVVVTWPLYDRVCRLVGGRRGLASVMTFLIIALLVFGPVSALVYLFVLQALIFVQDAAHFVQSGELQRWVDDFEERFLPPVEATIARVTGQELDLLDLVAEPIEQGLLFVLNSAGTLLPTLLSATATVSIDMVIFVFAVLTLYVEGPRVLRVIKNLSPMEDAYEDELFGVFREFSNNIVIGSLATSAIQGVVAGIGYAIAGVDQVVLWAILTAIGSFVPIIGSALVWIPIAMGVGLSQGPGWAIFVVVWSLAFTGTIDNVLRPLFMRGASNIHPLLIFLGMFGGLAWMGIPGLLVGPVVIAFFLALYTIYLHDYLEEPLPDPAGPGGPSWLQGWIARWRRWWAPPAEEEAEEPDSVDGP